MLPSIAYAGEAKNIKNREMNDAELEMPVLDAPDEVQGEAQGAFQEWTLPEYVADPEIAPLILNANRYAHNQDANAGWLWPDVPR